MVDQCVDLLLRYRMLLHGFHALEAVVLYLLAGAVKLAAELLVLGGYRHVIAEEAVFGLETREFEA